MKGLKVARIKGPRGLAGDLRVELYLEEPEFFKPGRVLEVWVPGQGPLALTVKFLRRVGSHWVMRFVEIGDRERAEALRGLELWAPAEELPPKREGEFYLHELIGLTARLPDGRELGAVEGVVPGDPAHLLLPGGVLVPFTERFVKQIDPERGVLILDVPEEAL